MTKPVRFDERSESRCRVDVETGGTPHTLEEVAAAIRISGVVDRMVLISIEGLGGAGKTTTAEALRNLLGDAYVVGVDDFIVKEKLAEPSWENGSFDRARLEREVLEPAVTGTPIAHRRLVWHTNTLSDSIVAPPCHYLIVEGISVAHPDIAHYYDFNIWIEVPADVARERGRARDGSNENAQYWDLWSENDRRYQEVHHTRESADFIVDNS
jgi:uridine kinase